MTGTFDLGVEVSLNTVLPVAFRELFPWHEQWQDAPRNVHAPLPEDDDCFDVIDAVWCG